jgi:hypothetical protein
MGEGLKRAAAAARATQKKPVTGARAAHAQGKVWAEVRINGGKVPLKETIDSPAHPIGTMSMKGPMAPEQSFVLWMAAKGLDPLAIAEEVARYVRPGRNREQASTVRELLSLVRDGGLGEGAPSQLAELREAWITSGCPGL